MDLQPTGNCNNKHLHIETLTREDVSFVGLPRVSRHCFLIALTIVFMRMKIQKKRARWRKRQKEEAGTTISRPHLFIITFPHPPPPEKKKDDCSVLIWVLKCLCDKNSTMKQPRQGDRVFRNSTPAWWMFHLFIFFTHSWSHAYLCHDFRCHFPVELPHWFQHMRQDTLYFWAKLLFSFQKKVPLWSLRDCHSAVRKADLCTWCILGQLLLTAP